MFPVTFWWRDMMSHLNYYAHLAATRKSFGFAATHRVDCGYLSSSCFPAIERKRAHNVNMYPRRYITQRNNSSQHLAWWTKKKLAVQGLGWFSSQGPAGYLRCWGWLLFSESSTKTERKRRWIRNHLHKKTFVRGGRSITIIDTVECVCVCYTFLGYCLYKRTMKVHPHALRGICIYTRMRLGHR